MRAGIDGLDGFTIEDEPGGGIEACQSPVWDTALAVIALADAGMRRRTIRCCGRRPAGSRARRSPSAVTGRVRRPHLHPAAGRSSSPTTTTPTSTTRPRSCSRCAGPPTPTDAADATARVAWVEGMQCRDGGWGAFDVDNTRTLVPGAAVLRLRRADRPAERGRDRPRRRDAGGARPARERRRSTAARAWLLRPQEADGSWFGRWGANYVYGTGAVVPALVAAGAGARRTRRSAGRSRWLRAPPERRRRLGRGPALLPGRLGLAAAGESTASQTAWALLALLAAGERSAGDRARAWPSWSRPSGRRRLVGRAVVHRHRVPRRLLHQLPPLPARVPGHGARAVLATEAADGLSSSVLTAPARRGARRRRRRTTSSAPGRARRGAPGAALARRLDAEDCRRRWSASAGGLDGRLRPGDIVVATELRTHRAHASSGAPGAPLLAGELRRAGSASTPGPLVVVHRATCAGRAARRSARRAALSPSTWSRRGWSACAAGPPLAVVRAIADTAERRPRARRRPGAAASLARGARGRSSAGQRACGDRARCCSPGPDRSAPGSSGPSRSSSARWTGSARRSTSAARSSTTPTSCASSRPRARCSSRSSTRSPPTPSWSSPPTACRPRSARRPPRAPDLDGHRRHLPAGGQGPHTRRAGSPPGLPHRPGRPRRPRGGRRAPSARRPTDSTWSTGRGRRRRRSSLDADRPVAYLTQTTLADRRDRRDRRRAASRVPDLVGPAADDICYATQNRQDAVRAIAAACDLMLVVGSANSSNTARLVEVARGGLPGRADRGRVRARARLARRRRAPSASPPARRRPSRSSKSVLDAPRPARARRRRASSRRTEETVHFALPTAGALMPIPLRQNMRIGAHLLRQRLKGTKYYPLHRRDRAALRVQPGLPGLRQDPAPDRDPAPAPVRRGRASRRSRSAGRRWSRSPAASRCCTPTSSASSAELVRRKIYVYLCTNAVLLRRASSTASRRRGTSPGSSTSTASRAPRRGGRPRGRLRQGGRRHPGGQGRGLPGHDELDVLQHRLAEDRARRARLPERRARGRRDDDLAGLRLREGPRPGALPRGRADPRAVQRGLRRRQAQALAAQPLPAVPRLPRGQGGLRVHGLGHPELLGARLAAALLPDGRRVRRRPTRSCVETTDWSRTGGARIPAAPTAWPTAATSRPPCSRPWARSASRLRALVSTH